MPGSQRGRSPGGSDESIVCPGHLLQEPHTCECRGESGSVTQGKVWRAGKQARPVSGQGAGRADVKMKRHGEGTEVRAMKTGGGWTDWQPEELRKHVALLW